VDKIRAEFLEKYDFWYSENKKDIIKNEKLRNKLISQFQNIYKLEYLTEMTIDEYVIGKKSQSFCWWVETNTRNYCEIRGGMLNAFQRFGIYYDNKLGEYIFKRKNAKISKFGNNKNEVYANVKKELINLVNAIKENDLDIIAENKINPLVKNKITYLYAPNDYLPIAGENDLNVILQLLNIPFNSTEDRIYKRKKLYDFYKSLGREDMTTQMFIDFIYNDLGYRFYLRTTEKNNEEESVKVKNYKLIEVKSVEELIRTQKRERHGLVKEGYETYNQKKLSGKKGEDIAKQFLNSHKNQMKIKGELDMACEYDDSKHYDISFKTQEGKTVFIDVKSTKALNGNKVVFEMSEAEYAFMKEHEDNYFIYFIDDVYNGNVIKSISAKHIRVRPIKYRAELVITDSEDVI